MDLTKSGSANTCSKGIKRQIGIGGGNAFRTGKGFVSAVTDPKVEIPGFFTERNHSAVDSGIFTTAGFCKQGQVPMSQTYLRLLGGLISGGSGRISQVRCGV